MTPNRRRALAALAAMSGAAVLARVAIPTNRLADQRPTDLDTMFPTAFGRWQVDANMPVVLPAPDVQAKLDAIYNQVLSRTYVSRSGSDRMMLSVAYGGDQSDGMQVHLPEVCYPAQGFEVRSRRRDGLSIGGLTLPVVRVETRLGRRIEPITYWITVGDQVVPTRSEQKLAQIRYSFDGLIPDGMLVRVSSIDADSRHAWSVQDEFIRDLQGAMSAGAGTRVFGQAISAATAG